MNIYFADFETYYDSEYSLRKQVYTEYLRDPRFQVIGVGIRDLDGSYHWMEEAAFRDWLACVDWSCSAIGCHNTLFDGGILSFKYGIKPAMWFDTLGMASAAHGAAVGGSLAALMKHYGVGEKGKEVLDAVGMRREHFSYEAWLRYGEYCKNDVRGTWEIFVKMLEEGFPDNELRLIDMTIRMFTEPVLRLDEELMKEYHREEVERKNELMARIGVNKHLLSSNNQFAKLLEELDVEPPTKISPKGNEIFAFAKSDPAFQELLECHPKEEVRMLCEARLAVKSTINETRAMRFLKLADGGQPLPMPLRYAGAATFRWSGEMKLNVQNLERGE